MSDIRIISLDCETGPHYSAHFGRWNENIGYAKTIQEGRVISYSAKTLNQKTVRGKSIRSVGQLTMLEDLYEEIDKADAIISYNGDKFDLKRINSEFLRQGWSPPSPVHSIDLYKEVRRQFGFSSNKLDDILAELGLERKLEHAGMELWIDCTWYDKPAAWREMLKYNKQDVVVTEELYHYMSGWIKNHPNLALWMEPEYDDEGNIKLRCQCGSTDLRFKGYKHTKVMGYKQYRCNNCGRYPRVRQADERFKGRKDVMS